MQKFEIGDKISYKFEGSKDNTKVDGVVSYVYNDGMGLIVQPGIGVNKDRFILTKGMVIEKH